MYTNSMKPKKREIPLNKKRFLELAEKIRKAVDREEQARSGA